MICYDTIINNYQISAKYRDDFKKLQQHNLNIFIFPILQHITCDFRNNNANNLIIKKYHLRVSKQTTYFITVELSLDEIHELINDKQITLNDSCCNIEWTLEDILENNDINTHEDFNLLYSVFNELKEKNKDTAIINQALKDIFHQLCVNHCVAPLITNHQDFIVNYDSQLLTPKERNILNQEIF